MPQVLDGKSGRWSLYQSGPDNVASGTGQLALEHDHADVVGSRGGAYLACLYGIVDPAGVLIQNNIPNVDKFIFVYDANVKQATADMKYPRLIIPVKSQGAFFYDAPWEEIEWIASGNYADGRYAPYNEGIRVYLSSTMDRLTVIQDLLGITQARTMLCRCG